MSQWNIETYIETTNREYLLVTLKVPYYAVWYYDSKQQALARIFLRVRRFMPRENKLTVEQISREHDPKYWHIARKTHGDASFTGHAGQGGVNCRDPWNKNCWAIYLLSVLFIVLCHKAVLTLESVAKVAKCAHSSERYSAVLLCEYWLCGAFFNINILQLKRQICEPISSNQSTGKAPQGSFTDYTIQHSQEWGSENDPITSANDFFE